MNRILLALLLCFLSLGINAQSILVGVHGGGGPLYEDGTDILPSVGSNTQCGIDVGIAVHKYYELMTGAAVSNYSMQLAEIKVYRADQQLRYYDIPISIRVTLHRKHKLHMYLAPGVKFSFVTKAHYVPINRSSQTHITVETDNNNDFKPIVVRPSLGFGVCIPIKQFADINFGVEFSTATKPVTKIRRDIQGYNLNVSLTGAAFILGFQFHIVKHTAK